MDFFYQKLNWFSTLALNPFLQVQIDKTLAAVCDFADSVISEGRFTQILSVGIGSSALGPQFIAEALAPDNPPLKVVL
ncbi:hypothetical protein GOBAR_DD35626 [Gossypium barbadense]|nr:hypothetical protein GOBAR_DD35626 [Gossypium barbadense]